MQISRIIFTFGQAAEALGVRRTAVVTWVRDGRLHAIDLDGRRRVSALELERVQREGIPPIEQRARPRRCAKIPKNVGDEIRRIPINTRGK